MAVHIRLARAGAKKRPFYRLVVTDQRSPRGGRFLENIGTYDPSKDPGQGENPIAWTQTLATVRDKLDVDASRRFQAALPAYGEGILVCPTNAGAVLAIDLLTHSLVWAHSYRKVLLADANQPMQMQMQMQMMQMRRFGGAGMVVREGQPPARHGRRTTDW